MSAPIISNASRTPVRVGFTPTLAITKSESGTIEPATSQNAAELISPGTITSCPLSCCLSAQNHRIGIHINLYIGTKCPQHSFTVIARSLWFSHDRFAMPPSTPPTECRISPEQRRSVSGNESALNFVLVPPTVLYFAPSRPQIVAPICCNGLTTRDMGRERKERSPVTTKKRSAWLARIPSINRIVVPELPASKTSTQALAAYPSQSPCTLTRSVFSSEILPPSPKAIGSAAGIFTQ
jgi:hypothetical protein